MVITASLFIISFGLELEGYFRARPRLLYNISLAKLQSVDPLITYFDSRGLLNVKLGDENIKLISRVDIIDNAVWGYNVRGASDAPLAQVVSFNDIVGKEVPPIKIKRLYLDIRTKIGAIMAGFMPSHFGLGMYVNSGDSIYNDYGDTYARIAFATKPLGKDSNLITAIFFDKVVEGAVIQEGSSDILDADTDDLGIAALYNNDFWRGGFYSTLRFQEVSPQSKAFLIDGYFETKTKFYLALELATLLGRFQVFRDQTLNISSFGGLIRAGYKFSWIFPYAEFGYASPPGDNEFSLDTNRRGTELKGFRFHPDYDPALILFNFLGGAKVSQPVLKGFSTILESRSVFSAYYLKINNQIKVQNVFIIPSLILAFDSKNSKFLGVEPDLEIRNKLLSEKREEGKEVDYNLFLSLRMGLLIPGKQLKEVERPGEQGTKESPVFGIVGLIGYEF
jgi:hypothetical protein